MYSTPPPLVQQQSVQPPCTGMTKPSSTPGQRSFLRSGLVAAQGQPFNSGSPGSGLHFHAPLRSGEDLQIAPLDLGPPVPPLGSSLDSKSSLSSFVPGSSLPSSLPSFFSQVLLPFAIRGEGADQCHSVVDPCGKHIEHWQRFLRRVRPKGRSRLGFRVLFPNRIMEGGSRFIHSSLRCDCFCLSCF